MELAVIRRMRTLKNQATAFLGAVFLSALVVYDGFLGDSPV